MEDPRRLMWAGVAAFFLGGAIYAGARRALRPALVEEPMARRGSRRPTVLGA